MSYCVNCGAQLPDGTRYCTNCGAQQGAASPYYQPPVPQYSTGGLVAWGIITLLLCTIPGVVALVKVANINNARTVEEQQRAVSDVPMSRPGAQSAPFSVYSSTSSVSWAELPPRCNIAARYK